MLQKKYKSEVISIKNPFKGIYTIEFRSLNGKYKYNPGQFLHLALDQDYDGSFQWPESRCFSMQSNPDQDTIKITYSVKGWFTRQIEQQLMIGSQIWLKLPYGDLFTQHHNKMNAIFIAGGTGITPFLSLFTHKSFMEYKNPQIYLGFKSPEFNIYLNDLNSIDSIKYYYENLNGFIDINNFKFDSKSKNQNIFISGPPNMIKTLKKSLSEKGISDNQILTDSWE